MNKKKIAYFGVKYYPSKGGTSRIVENLIRELTYDYDITIYCFKDKRAKDYIKGVKAIQFPCLFSNGIGTFIYYIISCIHILIHSRYDLIHSHKVETAFFAPFLTLKSKVVLTIHELGYQNDKWGRIGKSYFHLMERFFLYSNVVRTTVSKILQIYYKDRYDKLVNYIPNAINSKTKYNDKAARRILELYSIDGEYIFLAARRILAIKGCHTLIKALIDIDYKGTLIIAGDEKQRPEYITELIKMSANKIKVRFIGYINSIQTLLSLVRMSYLFVFPSEIEAMSVMLLEVISVGNPLVCSDIPANTTILRDNETLFFENKNHVDLADKLRWAFANMDEMKNRADNAKKRILEYYSWNNIAKQYKELYDSKY